MESVSIKGQVRESVGKKAAKAVKREGLVPCVIYGGDQVIHFTADSKDFKALIYTASFKLAEIEVAGKTHKCIVKDLQFHPVTDDLQHIDFLELVPGKDIKVAIPVRFRGQAPGVKLGGKLTPKLRRVKIKTKPEHLVDELFADVSGLDLGQSIRVRDIEVSEGMEVMSAMGTPIASIEVPRALRSAAAAAGKEEEAAAE